MPIYQGENHTHKWLNKGIFTKPGADSFIDKVFRTDMTRLIVDDPVKRVDNMTMAWGLEARVPFMDTELVEWALKHTTLFENERRGKVPTQENMHENFYLLQSLIERRGIFQCQHSSIFRVNFLEFMSDILLSSCLS